jgi:hypothetical protein
MLAIDRAPDPHRQLTPDYWTRDISVFLLSAILDRFLIEFLSLSLSLLSIGNKTRRDVSNFMYLIASLFSLSLSLSLRHEREWWREIRHLLAEIYQSLGPRGGVYTIIINTVALSPSQNSNCCVTRECATRFHSQLIILLC